MSQYDAQTSGHPVGSPPRRAGWPLRLQRRPLAPAVRSLTAERRRSAPSGIAESLARGVPAVCLREVRAISGAEPRSPWGGDGVAGAPPLTRLATQHPGNLEPGFSKRMPGSARGYRKITYTL